MAANAATSFFSRGSVAAAFAWPLVPHAVRCRNDRWRVGWRSPRNYKRTASLDQATAVLDLLEDRLRDYDANVVRVNSGEVATTIARILAERGKRRLVIPAGLAEALGEPLPAGPEFIIDQGLSTTELRRLRGRCDGVDGGHRGDGNHCAAKCSGPGKAGSDARSRLSSCACCAGGSDVVETVPEAIARHELNGFACNNLCFRAIGNC